MDTSKTGGVYVGNEQSITKTLTINAAAETIISHPKKRRLFYARNTSTTGQVITIVLSNELPAVSNVGIILKPGESFTDSSSEGYKSWSGKIRAISDVIGASLTTTEITEDNI